MLQLVPYDCVYALCKFYVMYKISCTICNFKSLLKILHSIKYNLYCETRNKKHVAKIEYEKKTVSQLIRRSNLYDIPLLLNFYYKNRYAFYVVKNFICVKIYYTTIYYVALHLVYCEFCCVCCKHFSSSYIKYRNCILKFIIKQWPTCSTC